MGGTDHNLPNYTTEIKNNPIRYETGWDFLLSWKV